MKPTLLFLLLLTLTHGFTLAQPSIFTPVVDPPKQIEPVIFIGQPVEEVQAVLKSLDKMASDLPFPFPAGGREFSFLGFTLDPDGINAQVFYSNITRRVTSLAILFQPIAGADKSSEAWVSAGSLRLNKDRTFDIRFTPPKEPEYEITTPATNKQEIPINNPEALIFVGQDVAAAETILRSKKIDYGSRQRAVMLSSKDLDEYTFGIDQQHSYGHFSFSKTTKKITGFGVTFVPAQKQSYKLNQTIVDIHALRYNQDGSYEIRFTAPLTAEERADRERKRANIKNVYPTKPDD